MPWVPLTHFDGPPEPVLQRCRAVIDEKAAPAEHANLLAVTQVLMGLRYNDPGLLRIFGGKEGMIESPVLQEVLQEAMAERSHKLIRGLLEDRFGPLPADIAAALAAVKDEERLDQLNRLAGRCPDLEAFRRQLGS